GAQLAILNPPDNPAGPSGLAAVGADGSVALVMRDLAPTSGTQVYETWLIGADARPIPIGHFTVDASRTASFVTARASLGPGVTVALSLEPGPGATTPTTVVALGQAGAQES
ncbi:MAG TPA: anti-sigma factor, partial [Candidatus Binatia bacterium]|nr:anti-sigma factor [Candidatus Binatia bacterium]